MTTRKSAPSPKVHQYLLPVISQSLPSRRARVARPEMSEPVPGSDMASAPRNCPLAMRLKYFSFCAGEKAEPGMMLCAIEWRMMLETLIQALASSSEIRQYSKQPMSRPPYSVGILMPK